MIKINRALAALSAVALCAILPSKVWAQDKYPVSTVNLITLSKPGGGTDVYLREMSKYLHDALGPDFVVQNVLGGSGAVAMAKTATARPDGGTLFGSTPTYIFTSLLSQPQVSYKDLQPVANLFFDPQTLYVSASSPFHSLKDLIDAAKKDPKAVKLGVTNPGSMDRQIIQKFEDLTGLTSPVVTNDGGGELLISVLNGTVNSGTGEVQELRGQMEAGKIRILATFTDDRLASLPDIPTAKEQGVDLVVHKFRGLVGPKGMSPEVVKAWEDALPKILANPEFKKWYTDSDMIPAFMTHDKYQAMIDEFAKEQHDAFVKNGMIAQ
ncbi:MAG TPA: tripartite tricarboxylate transporter substrate binding protein [Dongiaceae bacterium]